MRRELFVVSSRINNQNVFVFRKSPVVAVVAVVRVAENFRAVFNEFLVVTNTNAAADITVSDKL